MGGEGDRGQANGIHLCVDTRGKGSTLVVHMDTELCVRVGKDLQWLIDELGKKRDLKQHMVDPTSQGGVKYLKGCFGGERKEWNGSVTRSAQTLVQ